MSAPDVLDLSGAFPVGPLDIQRVLDVVCGPVRIRFRRQRRRLTRYYARQRRKGGAP